jgi:phosphatidylinositol alpha-1,6-mannosyltransferase
MSDSLRVLLVTLDYPPPPGGIQTVVKNLEEGLRELGHIPSVLHIEASSESRSLTDLLPRRQRLYGFDSIRR